MKPENLYFCLIINAIVVASVLILALADCFFFGVDDDNNGDDGRKDGDDDDDDDDDDDEEVDDDDDDDEGPDDVANFPKYVPPSSLALYRDYLVEVGLELLGCLLHTSIDLNQRLVQSLRR